MDMPADKAAFLAVTRSELAVAIRKVMPCSMPDARDFVDVVIHEIANALVEGRTVKLHNFGVFEVRAKAARLGRNPRAPWKTSP